MKVLYHKLSQNASILVYNLLIMKIRGETVYDLGALIKSLRKERNITQKKLGELLGVSEATVSKYEANQVMPAFETLRTIASIFNVSMDTLCGMKHQGTLSTHGLTESQTESVKALIDAYRIRNAQTGRQLTQEQFAVLGKITAEMTK